MSIQPRNERLIAYKKLVGKTHTSSQKGAPGETIPSNVQTNTKEIFANTPIYDQDETNLLFCQKVEFTLEPVAGSQYVASTTGTEAQGESNILQINVDHGFALMQGNDDSLQTDAKKQLVPPSFGVEFKAKVYDVQGNQLADDGAQDWSIDYYSGVLFMQDMGGVTPATVEAYLYTGKFVSDVIVEVQDSDDTLLKGIVDRLEVKETTAPAPQFDKIQSADTVAVISGSAGISGDLEVNGTLHTNKLIVEETTEVVTKTNFSGENIFGDATSETEGKIDTHTFYGNVNINGNLDVSGEVPTKKKIFEITRESAGLNGDNDYVSVHMDDPPSGLSGIEKGDLILINSLDTVEDTIDTVEIFLPNIADPSWNGIEYTFKHLCGEGHVVSIGGSEGREQKIDNDNSIVLHAKYETVTIVAYNQKWHIV